MFRKISRLALAASASLLVAANDQSGAAAPFWKLSEGCWLSENTYLNRDMEPNIAAYSSVTCIVLEEGQVIETENKFYPPSKLATDLAGPLLGDGEGVEVQTEIRHLVAGSDGRAIVAKARPEMLVGGQVTLTTPVSDDTAIVTSGIEGEQADSYRMFITLPTADRRYVLNLGLDNGQKQDAVAGDIRGFSIFRQRRIDKSEVGAWRNRLRERYAVGVFVVGSDDRQRNTRRLREVEQSGSVHKGIEQRSGQQAEGDRTYTMPAGVDDRRCQLNFCSLR